jgi:hypothetical protein
VTITIEFSPQAQRMLEEADDRWSAQHERSGNPLLDEALTQQIYCARCPSSVSSIVEADSAVAPDDCSFARADISTTRTSPLEASSCSSQRGGRGAVVVRRCDSVRRDCAATATS